VGIIRNLKLVVEHPINRSHEFRALLRVLKWQIGARLVPGPVVFAWIDGARFIVRRGETGLTGNLYCGLHEFSEMAFLLHVLTPDDCFVDVGANVGSYTILACAARKARGYSFEPVPSTFNRLVDNIRLNDLENRVTALNCGVADRAGEMRFTVSEGCQDHVVASGEDPANQLAVKVVSLDSVLGSTSANLIKIDVEGFETPVLMGARETLSNPKLHSVIMEVNGSGRRYGYSDEDLVRLITDFGFVEYEYLPFQRQLRPAGPASMRSGNAIFVRDYKLVSDRISSAPVVEVFGRGV
jgi:FkbM family methyltransferase